MSSGLLDSSILIDWLRGRAKAIAFLASQSAAGPLATHVVVAAELLAGARDKREQGLIDSFLTSMQIVCPDESDGLAALDFYRRYHLSHGVDWPDCQIAATAVRLGMAVYTEPQALRRVPGTSRGIRLLTTVLALLTGPTLAHSHRR